MNVVKAKRTGVRNRSVVPPECRDQSPFDPTGTRFVIEDIYPNVDGGRYPVKRIAGESVDVWADVFRDGHDVIAAALLWRAESSGAWHRVPMCLDSNDRWRASFVPPEPGLFLFAIEAWTDRFATWRKEFMARKEAGQDLSIAAQEGLDLLPLLMPRDPEARRIIEDCAKAYSTSGDAGVLLEEKLAAALEKTEVRPDLTRSVTIPIVADRERARTGAWYEMVPRSQGSQPGQHGTFDDCIRRVPDIAKLGFDVLYLTPIHPVGRSNRKGKNNALTAEPEDPGSFYAIGNEHGGHDAVEPRLGTIEDFRRLVETCREHGMEVALDFAVQCSPDHPWIKEHPEWFSFRPDGTIRHAENPPKKYEDIVNPDFSCADPIPLWEALRSVVLFWIEQGVRIFRVDNPHTKPFPFWEWLIRQIRGRHSDVIFLSEAFTRPKVMKALAKLGFSQSYTYFTWRTTKDELQSYLSEITRYPEREYFRPNFFVTTPDILPYQLQSGEPWIFKSRLTLAATLSSNYGIYNGFELLEHDALPGREEYLHSEKYEIKVRDWDKPGNIKDYIRQLNAIRHENPALQQTANLRFLPVDNPNVIGFLKESVDGQNAVACAISLVGTPQEFWLHFGDEKIGRAARLPVRRIESLKGGESHLLQWGGARLRIDPGNDPALIYLCQT
ncbi:MAG TPA: alpha-1,4-glucan--maltose-1-phosphate maltosyltransferase [Pseudolabrys sp.]|nr:alpha-1,4-glucan--maltose-1-phosphate maltosyltransferase [Pseudolabrys sp.]